MMLSVSLSRTRSAATPDASSAGITAGGGTDYRATWDIRNFR